ncbi:unnamed protein product, partial [Larinioides sclopetarius]
LALVTNLNERTKVISNVTSSFYLKKITLMIGSVHERNE